MTVTWGSDSDMCVLLLCEVRLHVNVAININKNNIYDQKYIVRKAKQTKKNMKINT